MITNSEKYILGGKSYIFNEKNIKLNEDNNILNSIFLYKIIPCKWKQECKYLKKGTCKYLHDNEENLVDKFKFSFEENLVNFPIEENLINTSNIIYKFPLEEKLVKFNFKGKLINTSNIIYIYIIMLTNQ